MSKRPQNLRELRCWEALRAKGYLPTGRGWPSFFAWRKDGEPPAFILIRRGHRIKGTQIRIANVLVEAGLRVLIHTGTDLVPYIKQGGDDDEHARSD